MLDLGTRRVLAKKVVAFPVPYRSDRSRHKAAPAVRADVFQDVIDTRGAKRTLISADARFERVGWQRLIAVFAGRTKFEHCRL